ncbi:hypothetical protein FOMPIDRAFT_1061413 [Fomitopsis schrenkii]|uniref:Uncharacterized protein n=1 Tax=Fomitopsis schrenkii TaxID=2126942 RepID=S8FJ29_FOMSC|nr:hypothetical protein FOMPIDRAFT_1061413 [Fomitopsis schrenkii]
MPSIKSALLAFLFLAPLAVHSSPVIPTSPAHMPWRPRNEPDSLLGRRYVVQNHPGGAAKENATPSTPRAYPLHQGAPSGRTARFAKYLVERAATSERIQTPDGLVFDEGAGDAVGGAQDTTSSHSAYNTAVTLVPRPSGMAVAHAKAAAADKGKSTGKSAAKHGKTT